MIRVTPAAFFATVGQLDVHPTPVGKWDNEIGYRSEWKLRNGRLVGTSEGARESRYHVTPAYFNENRGALAAHVVSNEATA